MLSRHEVRTAKNNNHVQARGECASHFVLAARVLHCPDVIADMLAPIYIRVVSRLLAIKQKRAWVGHTETTQNLTEPQNHRQPRRTEEDNSLKWGELAVFLKFIQTYLGPPSFCVDGHVFMTCV